MGLLDRLFRKPELRITDPARLRDELFDAARRGDARRLERVARANEADVLTQFPSWQKVPVAIRADPAQVQGYVHVLVTIAQLFADRLRRPELMAALTGPAESNPITKWQTSLRLARQLLDDLRYDEARPLLADALIDSRTMSGSGVDALLPVTHGYLAEAHFYGGRAAEAVPHLDHALAACERTGDNDGVIAYLGSLFEVHRYVAQAEQAAAYAGSARRSLRVEGRGSLAHSGPDCSGRGAAQPSRRRRGGSDL